MGENNRSERILPYLLDKVSALNKKLLKQIIMSRPQISPSKEMTVTIYFRASFV